MSPTPTPGGKQARAALGAGGGAGGVGLSPRPALLCLAPWTRRMVDLQKASLPSSLARCVWARTQERGGGGGVEGRRGRHRGPASHLETRPTSQILRTVRDPVARLRPGTNEFLFPFLRVRHESCSHSCVGRTRGPARRSRKPWTMALESPGDSWRRLAGPPNGRSRGVGGQPAWF